MRQVVVGWDLVLGPWLAERTKGTWDRTRGPIIGLVEVEDGRPTKILGALQATDCNGASVVFHLAAGEKCAINREFLWFIFHYAFNQLGVNKVIAPIASDNITSRRFTKAIGFNLEATLKDASPKGDMMLYSITKEQAHRWLSLGDKYRGQTLRPSTT